jgi:hypothetical protein
MSLAFIIAGISFVLLICLSWLFSRERRAGRRFVLSQVRSLLDSGIVSIAQGLKRFFVYITKYIITLSWYYSLHAFLRLTLKSLASMYYVVERLTHQNRDRAREIRRERKRGSRSHLEVLTEHKDDTKLTEQQMKKLKDNAINQK